MLKLTVFSCLLVSVLAIDIDIDIDIEPHPPFEAIYEWKTINYNWPSQIEREQAKTAKDYVEVNNAIAGIKLWKDKMYLSIPRWKSGIPVTLAVTSAIPVNENNTAPLLDPYPNWDMQSVGDCRALQFVQSMEIDPLGRMWVLDTGRTDTMALKPVTKCPPRLVILDLENKGNVLRSYVFPEHVAHNQSAYLNDIVLDHEDGGMAYITDNGGTDPGIIVFSLANRTSWKVRHDSMKPQNEAVTFQVSRSRVTSPIGLDGIALSPPGPDRLVYYSPLSSVHLYSIPTSALKNSTLKDVNPFVLELGRRKSQTDGMVMTNQNSLYFGLLADDAIAQWDPISNPSLTTGVRTVFEDPDSLQWPDTFGIDENGQLWCVTNRFQNYLSNYVETTEPSYRVLWSNTSAKNYQYFMNGTAPDLPVIIAGADHMNIALSTCLTIALVYLAR